MDISSLDAFLKPPTPEWARSLVSLSLAIVSAGAALYSAAVVPWAAELSSATAATEDENGMVRNRKTAEGARTYQRLKDIRARDPAKGIGLVAALVAVPMAVLGVFAGLSIPNVGILYTVVPVLVSAAVALVAAFIPGRSARAAAKTRIKEMEGGSGTPG